MESSPPPASFQIFSSAHLSAIVLIMLAAGLFSLTGARLRSAKKVQWLSWFLVVMLLGNEIVHYVYVVTEQGWNRLVDDYLPLHFCDLAVFATAYALVARKQTIFEIAYFWGLAGSVQAIITPDLQYGYPSYAFMRFFFGHGGIIVGVLFAAFCARRKPRFKGVILTGTLSLALAGMVGCLNLLMGTNYMYLCAPPQHSASVFFFLPWPWYIPFLTMVGLVYFVLLWLPFGIRDVWKRRRSCGL